MKRLFKIFTLCFLAQIGHSQCDTTGILLELQATTNIQGFLFGNDRCLVEGSIIAPLYVSGDSLLIDTTAFGSGTVTSVATTAPAAGFTISGGPITTSGTFLFTLANDLAALEGISGNGIAVRTASETWTTRTITASTGIIVADGDGVAGNPTITNTAPDQVVSVTGAGINVVTGTYPTFTITGTEVGNGTVTNFSAGDLSPLFTTTEATTTTTPALSFVLTSAGANTFFGNNTDAGAAPSYRSATALTKTDDTNVTMTLGGAPNNSLLRAVSMTLGWTGTLAVSRGGIGVGTITGLMQGNGTGAVTGIPNSSVVGQTLRVTGASTYAWGALDLSDTDAITGDLPFSNITQGAARSVFGVTGNATADMASIQGTADQVLRVTTAGTALSFGTVATGGITDDAVTYAKLQNVAANNVLIGNDNGAGQNAQELTVAEVYTLLGMTGVDTRIAVWKGANTLGNDAGLVFDYTNDRQTITCTTPTFGAGTAILNVTNVGTDGTAEFIQSRGNIDGNLICNQTNLSSTASSNSFYQIQQQGDASGDAFLQFATLGAGGITHSIGLDNSDGNRFKLTPNATTPGGNVNMGVILRDNAGIGNTGINKDFPGHPLDGLGRAAFELWQGGAGNQWTFAGNVAYGNGAGTGPSGVTIVGHGNAVRISFTTGTSPTLDGDVLILGYPFTFTTTSIVTFSARNSDATQPDFYISAENNAGCTLKVRGTLTASTTYHINFHLWGY